MQVWQKQAWRMQLNYCNAINLKYNITLGVVLMTRVRFFETLTDFGAALIICLFFFCFCSDDEDPESIHYTTCYYMIAYYMLHYDLHLRRY